MSTPVPLRSDFDAAQLHKLARGSRDPDQTRRLLALAEVYAGGSRSGAARIGGVGLQIVRDWVLRFNAEGPDGLLNGKAPGVPSILDDNQRRALRQIVENGPIPAVHGVVRWRLIDLAQWAFEEFRVSISKQTLSRELRNMGFRKLSARPGQKNKITRRWAKRGTRPSAPRDQRTASAYIFGAICPAEGKGAGRVLPSCGSEAMALHLAEISIAVAPGAHAILLLDQAGWHVSKKLPIPDNITLLPFPPKSPELNPVENIWQFMRDNWLSNRIFKSHEDILDHCCFAWNKLIDMPWKIMSIGIRDWAYWS